MHQVTTVERLETIIGTPASVVVLKAVSTLDEGCRRILAASSVAGLGFRNSAGAPVTTFVGGPAGFARTDSPTRISIDLRSGQRDPALGGGISFVFMIAGLGETLRLNGRVAGLTGDTLDVDVDEAYVHCARSILRSGLWEEVAPGAGQAPGASLTVGAVTGPGPLGDPAVSAFLQASPFLVVSSWGADGTSDTSPRGDSAGFARVLDSETLVVPDRRGNKRADTFHNLLSNDQLSLAALIPGRDDVLHLSGTALMSEDPGQRATMKTGGITPKAALVIHVDRAGIVINDVLRASTLWDGGARVHPPADLDLNQVASQHMARNEAHGAKASVTRVLGKGLAASPKLLKRAMDANYRKALKDEGY